MLSGAKHLTVRREMLRSTQHDSPDGAMKLDRVVATGLLLVFPARHNGMLGFQQGIYSVGQRPLSHHHCQMLLVSSAPSGAGA